MRPARSHLRIDRPQKIRRLDGRFDRLEALVTARAAGAGERLLFDVASENAEHTGNAGVERDALQTGGCLRGDVDVVVGFVADDGAETDDRVVAAGLREALGGDRKLEGAR